MAFGGSRQGQFNHYDRRPYGWGFQYGDSSQGQFNYLARILTPYGPTIRSPSVARFQYPQLKIRCEICDIVAYSKKCMEAHKNGKKHQSMLREKASKEQESRHKSTCRVEHLSSQSTISKHKNFQQNDIGVSSKIPAEGSEGKPKDNTKGDGHGFKRKIGGDTAGKCKEINNGIKRPMVSSKPDASALSNSAESLVQKPALASPPGPASPVMAPTRVGGSSTKLKFQHVSASQTQVSEGKEHHEIQNPTAEKNDQPQSISEELHDQTASDVNTMTGDLKRGLKRKIRKDTASKVKKMNDRIKKPMKSSKPDDGALSNSTESLVHKPALTPPLGPASPILTSTHIGGSSSKLPFQHVSASQTQVSEGKEHHEIQNPTAEKNDQWQSISEELQDQTASDVRTITGDLKRGLNRKIREDTVRKVKKMNNGIKNPVKSSKPDVVALSNSTESLVHKPALTPLSRPAAPIMTSTLIGGSSSKLPFQHVSASQTQESEGKEHHEIQNPTAEKNDQPQSISEEFQDQTVSDVSTMTGDLRRGLKGNIREDTVGKVKKMNNGIKKPMKSSKPDDGALSNSTESLVHKPALTPPLGPASPILTSTHIGGSSSKLKFQHVSASQTQVSEGKEHHEIQNPTAEKNDQPQSISEKFHDQRVSDVSTMTGDLKRFLNRKIRENTVRKVKKMNNGIKKPMKSLKPDVGALSNSTESLVLKPALTPPPGLSSPITMSTHIGGSSSKLPFQHVSASQTQVSESKEHHEIQNPTAETSEELHLQTTTDVNTMIEDMNSETAALALAASPKGPMASQLHAPPPAPGSSFEPEKQLVLQTEVLKGKEPHEIQNHNVEIIDLPESISEELHDPAVSNINTQTENMKSDSSATAIAGPMASQVMVCLKCGDEGFSNTFVFCNKCQVYALHRYCLDGPVVFHDDITWFCEDCEPQCILLPSKTSDSANSAKNASQGKSDLTNYEESVKDNNDQQQNNTAERKVMLSDCHSATNHAQSQSTNNCEEEKFMEDCQSVPPVHDLCPIIEPIWRGSWCFSNQSSDTMTGLLAHLSTIACPNVLEETKLFPEVLSVNLLPRSAVWPKCFLESGPNDESLALYFFPRERTERAYDNLVEDMISHDLGIKAMIKNAELLVFPSTVLPIKHRRFQAKYYLWGIFRAKQHVTSS